MVYDLSLLDKCPTEANKSGAHALANAVATAQAAEKAGFRRYWVAEHHHSNDFASSAPEVLVAYLLASTRHIRIGSGGVMLQHYSPYKVAEIFNVLSSLAPDRVDLGVGKTPGGLPHTTKALQSEMHDETRMNFEEKVELLNQFLGGEEVKAGRFEGLAATPRSETKARGFLLGASVESAKLAAHLGWQLSYAGHLNGSDKKLKNTVSAYRKATGGGVPLLALAAIIGRSDKEAKERADQIFIYKIHFSDGKTYSLLTEEAAQEFGALSGRHDFTIEKHHTQIIAGTAETVNKTLHDLHNQYGIREFMLELPATSVEERIDTIAQLAYAQEKLAA
ncbi:MsnO8 family LLM class oxidoreductase [Bartonella tamiae]|uniref:Luciferase family oxidoreductase, group 1 n=1 Tax=Bartonella tamiae Th239 TaxID=1094558 RepID=J1K0D4_9HYPH|nr:MsnO8 family LLM class oxidoreductase [Bartonella tamiae]EJF90450.1 luciferase family oxidoreductase, group 1 [Bartonella tamiae Th239]EJF93606.1 luciferase family oxidoreductase, group 1 [Bartonella tamiae Th307]